MKYKVLTNTLINSRVCESGSEVEIEDEEYAHGLLEGGNITKDLSASPRTEGDPRAVAPEDVDTQPPAAPEAPASDTPLDQGSPDSGVASGQPTPEQVAAAANSLEDGQPSSDAQTIS